MCSTKKKYAFNNKGEKVFCKTTITEAGTLIIEFYLPKYGISYIHCREDLIYILGAKTTMDKRKFIVMYEVHPAYWLGNTFKVIYKPMQEVINEVFTKYIKLHV